MISHGININEKVHFGDCDENNSRSNQAQQLCVAVQISNCCHNRVD